MKIELKVLPITKSKIKQMNYIGIPNNLNIDVFGWVNLDAKRWVIIKFANSYYRAEFITDVIKENKSVQFPLASGGYEYPVLVNVKCKTFNRGCFSYSPERDDHKNEELYSKLVSFKRKTEIAGQIYY